MSPKNGPFSEPQGDIGHARATSRTTRRYGCRVQPKICGISRAKDLETGTFEVCVKQGTMEANVGLYYLFQATRREGCRSLRVRVALPEGPYALASIHSQEEQDMVAQLMYNMTGPVRHGWVVAYIGGMTEGDGVWYWCTALLGTFKVKLETP